MRIALAGISHETNTYAPGITRAEDFYQLRGVRMLKAAGQQTDLGGAVDACAQLGIEAVPLLYAIAQPSGLVDLAAYESFRDEIISGIAQSSPNGVVLLLHGAGVVESLADMEGDLVAAIRSAVGPLMPITASFDLHGNVTSAMTAQLNGVFACHEYPHVDMHLQSAAAVRLIAQMHSENFRAHCQIRRLPLLLPTTTTLEGGAKQALAKVLAAEAKLPDVFDLSWFHGFPYADVPHVGSSLVATVRPGVDAQPELERLATALWQARESFRPVSLGATEAVAKAQALGRESSSAGPIIIAETSDNCGAGAPGDGTHLLRAMLEARLGSQACFGFVVDPEVAAQAQAAGIGASLNVHLGGKSDRLHGATIEVLATVKALHDGRLVMQHMSKGARLNLGLLARLQIQGMDVVVASRRSQTFDREPFLAVGIAVERYRYVALKSSHHFRAGFSDLASAIVTADPPGLSTHQLDQFPRHATRRRLWPLHADAVYPEPAA